MAPRVHGWHYGILYTQATQGQQGNFTHLPGLEMVKFPFHGATFTTTFQNNFSYTLQEKEIMENF